MDQDAFNRHTLQRPVPLSTVGGAKCPQTRKTPGSHAQRGSLPPPSAQLVVLVHGINMGMFQWGHIADELAAAGHAVLAFDLYKRGKSEVYAAVDDTLALYTSQLAELLFAVGPATQYASSRPISLIGVSMGGAIAVGFTRRFPTSVARLGLVCPAGLPGPVPFVAKLARSRLLGDAIASFLTPKMLAKASRDAHFRPDHPLTAKMLARTERYIHHQCATNPWYLKGLLGTVRHFPLVGMSEDFAAVGRHRMALPGGGRLPRPTLIVWGDEDRVCAAANMGVASAHFPHARLVRLEGCGHADAWCTHYEALRTAIFEFLPDHEPAANAAAEERG